MIAKIVPLAGRNPDQDRELVGNIKVTRQDWLNVAMDLLISDGEDHVKVMTISERLEVSRSSFYWYFRSRKDLLDSLLDYWQQTNTAALVREAKRPADTITRAVCNVFKCFLDHDLFNNSLDFAIRDWARRSGKVRNILNQSESVRIDSLKAMFERYGYEELDALVRARTLYFMQIGYTDADLNEPMSERKKLVSHYLLAFTGQKPSPQELAEYNEFFNSIAERK